MTDNRNVHPTLIQNPRARSLTRYPPYLRERLSHASVAAAARVITGWSDYTATPLIALHGLAESVGVAALRYKDESARFGLGSFKALGGAYAALRALQDEMSRRMGFRPTADAIQRGDYRIVLSDITITCATDGNHGRAVAWGARRFGCQCVVYVPHGCSPYREAAIAAHGARTVRTTGNYDETLRTAVADASQFGHLVVTDTSADLSDAAPWHAMQGYGVLTREVLDQWGPDAPPTHVIVQAACGGFAASVCAYLWEHYGGGRPVFIVVESDQAPCLLESSIAGTPVTVTGALDTIMAGLSCGEVSGPGWLILDSGADFFMTVSDDDAIETMRILARGVDGDPAVTAGEAGGAGVAALRALRRDPLRSDLVGLDASSRVLVVGTEGATDPALYARIVAPTTH